MQGSHVVYRSCMYPVHVAPPTPSFLLTFLSLIAWYHGTDVNRHAQWMMDSFTSPERKKEVKAKPLEVLKKLGHTDLKLDEYESASLFSSKQ